jgi:hypothetical protein
MEHKDKARVYKGIARAYRLMGSRRAETYEAAAAFFDKLSKLAQSPKHGPVKLDNAHQKRK